MYTLAMWQVLCLVQLASAAKDEIAVDEIEDASVANAMHGAAHAMGLEVEHQLNQEWPVTDHEEEVIHDMLEKLKGGDSEWTWEKEEDSWTFGAVSLTEGTPNRALALHMIHRHGLGALLAARDQKAFHGRLESVSRNNLQKKFSPGVEQADYMSEALETYGPVEDLLNMLEKDLSLSALRNLHSYDHDWSTKKMLGQGCGPMSPGVCVLQAGLSKQTHEFMVDHGFNDAVCKQLGDRQQELMQQIQERALTNDSMPGIMAPKIKERYQTYKEKGQLSHTLSVENKRVKGVVLFEELGARSMPWLSWSKSTPWPVDMPMSKSEVALAAGFKGEELQAHLVSFVEERIEKKVKEHKGFVRKNRLHFWAGEDAEFASLTPTEEQWKRLERTAAMTPLD